MVRLPEVDIRMINRSWVWRNRFVVMIECAHAPDVFCKYCSPPEQS